MINRLRAMPWGTIAIGAAYIFAVLPLPSMDRMIWLGLAVVLAYTVIARRTTHATAELAQSADDQSVFALWRTSFRATLMQRGLLVLPMFSLMLAAHQFLAYGTAYCSVLLQAYCSPNSYFIQIELLVIAGGLLGVFLLLDHGLLVALTLLAHKHLPKSTAFVGNTGVALRLFVACVILSLGAVTLNLFQVTRASNNVTDRRILETVYPMFEPMVTNGILLNANIMSHPSFCSSVPAGQTCQAYDTRPFVARQVVSALAGMLMYVLLIVGVLRLTAPFSLQFSVAHAKAKRGPIDADAEIAYL